MSIPKEYYRGGLRNLIPGFPGRFRAGVPGALPTVVLLLGLASSQSARAYDRTPAGLDPPAHVVSLTITTTDSTRIKSWYLPAQDAGGRLLPGRHPAVLVVPREDDTLEDRTDLCTALARRGLAVLTFDHRGSGESEAFATDPRALVYPEFLTDCESGLDVLWAQGEVDTQRVAVYGESRGAVLALATANRRPEVRAVVSVSVPYSYKAYRKKLEQERPGREYFLPEGWRRREEPDWVIRRFNGGIFFIAGDTDLLTPVWMSRDLYNRYPRTKELWIVPGAAHDAARRPERVAGNIYYDRVAGFLHDELARKPHRGWPNR